MKGLREDKVILYYQVNNKSEIDLRNLSNKVIEPSTNKAY
jgi:hypothetical protein